MKFNRWSAAVLILAIAVPAVAANLGSSPMNIEDFTLELLSVERRANVLTVKWSVQNGGKAANDVKFVLVGDKTTTYAVDEENGKKYYVLTDKEGHGLASMHTFIGGSHGITERIKPGATKRYWMKLPAPPPSIKKINILFTDADPFEEIAITDK